MTGEMPSTAVGIDEFELAYHATCRFLGSGRTEPVIFMFGREGGGLKKVGVIKLLASPKDYAGHMKALGTALALDEVDLAVYVQESHGGDDRSLVMVHLVSATREMSVANVRDRQSGALRIRALDPRMLTPRIETQSLH